MSNNGKVVNGQDLEDRFDELKAERDDLVDAIATAKEDVTKSVEEDEEALGALKEAVTDAEEALTSWEEDNKSELEALESVVEDGKDYGEDWPNTTLIKEDYFVEYCQQLVDDLGDLPKNVPSYIVINWEETAENLKADYTETDWDGETYLFR